MGDGSGVVPKSFKQIVDEMTSAFTSGSGVIVDGSAGQLTESMLEQAMKQAVANFGTPTVWYTPTFINIRPLPYLREKDKPAYDLCEVACKLGLLKEKQLDQIGQDARNVHRRYWRRKRIEVEPFFRRGKKYNEDCS